jgi:hypothetical protein
MFQPKTVSRIVKVIGLLLIITAGIHTLNMSDAVIAIKTGDIAPSQASSVFSVWVFSSISMLLIGIWLFYLSGDLEKQNRRAWWQTFFIGSGLAGFSLISWFRFPRDIHLFYFLLLGLGLLIPLLSNLRKAK